ncbi:uncharacterized protein G2W53_010943 [Senna tora]|uniref:Uncharacterized protein n=1 Tax=Senna tora TaxID=362788 RepID=A0A835CAD4_9FABA|nr:uncharacterized protein G2W53_010943 [Senna tora]
MSEYEARGKRVLVNVREVHGKRCGPRRM